MKSKEILFSRRFKLVSSLLLVLFIGLAVSMLYFFPVSLSGRSILSLDTLYLPNESLQGKVSLSLKAGELMPADSLVVVNVGGEDYEFVLSDLISDEAVEGDFFIEGKSLSGTGLGYGLVGEKEVFPDVEFVMKVVAVESGGGSEGGGSGEEVSEEEVPAEEAPAEEPPVEEQPEESPSEEIVEEPVEETITEEVVGETVSEEVVSEETPIEETSGEEASAEEGVVEETTTEEATGEEALTSPITGAVISEAEVVEGITATVSADNPFIYELAEGETIEIVSSSQDVDVVVENGIATVTTSYSETEQGFGEGYLGDYAYDLEIDLATLEILAEEGDMVVSVNYQDIEIGSVSTVLSIDSPEGSVTEEVVEEVSNETVEVVENVTVTNVTEVNETVVSDFDLTDAELFVLKSNLGVDKVSITKAEVVNDRLVVRFELGDLWLEKSYDYSDEEAVKEQVGIDMKKWIKQVAAKLGEEEISGEEVEEFVGEFEL